MKVAVNMQTKKIVDLLPDNATANIPFLINNRYIMLDIENPVSIHIENEDGTISTTFRELTNAELLPYAKKSMYKRIEELEISLLRPMRELLSTVTSVESKNTAQIKVDNIESEIKALRDQLKE